MKRREFITLLGGAAVLPLEARAQQQLVRPLIGVLSPLSAASAARNIAGFRSGLRDLGYLEGRNATLEIRYGDGAPERMAPLAQELVALKPDVLMAGARSGALAAQAATQTIPIIVIAPDDPVVLGVAHSIAKPGGNITGTCLTTMRWSASGWNFSSSRCPPSRASRSSSIRTIQPTPSQSRDCRQQLAPWG
jgi:putative ABC transport system substrate-binding protein